MMHLNICIVILWSYMTFSNVQSKPIEKALPIVIPTASDDNTAPSSAESSSVKINNALSEATLGELHEDTNINNVTPTENPETDFDANGSVNVETALVKGTNARYTAMLRKIHENTKMDAVTPTKTNKSFQIYVVASNDSRESTTKDMLTPSDITNGTDLGSVTSAQFRESTMPERAMPLEIHERDVTDLVTPTHFHDRTTSATEGTTTIVHNITAMPWPIWTLENISLFNLKPSVERINAVIEDLILGGVQNSTINRQTVLPGFPSIPPHDSNLHNITKLNVDNFHILTQISVYVKVMNIQSNDNRIDDIDYNIGRTMLLIQKNIYQHGGSLLTNHVTSDIMPDSLRYLRSDFDRNNRNFVILINTLEIFNVMIQEYDTVLKNLNR